ncbi:MAG: glycine cleavage T C-terminal barrel domain-containing protein [Phycisphaeraceae bacterium]
MSIHDLQSAAGAEFIQFGPPPAEGGAELAESFGRAPAEYAAIRQRVGIMHLPQRAILRLTGSDRQDFLHRMMTQDINALTGGQTTRSFQLNDKGRIVADAVVHHGDADTWLEIDRLDLPDLHKLLEARLFTEDVTFEDFSVQREAIALHGPAAIKLAQALHEAGTNPGDIPAGQHHVLTLAGASLTAYRHDDAGAPCLRLLVDAGRAADLYQALLDAAGYDPRGDAEPDQQYAEKRRETLRGRPIGWLAYNTARIEAGTPLFHVDFGPDSLPPETGVQDEAVSFTKGCYIGQEILARIQNLGHPRRVLVGLRFEDDNLPVAGTQILPADGNPSQVVGGITSSTLSPLRGGKAIAFAVVKWGQHKPGTEVTTFAEGQPTRATIQGLGFIS